MQNQNSWEILVHFKSCSPSQLADTGFTADFMGDGEAGKVNQEIMNRGGSWGLYIPAFAEPLYTCLIFITSGVEGA